MSTISNARSGEYLKVAMLILQEKGGEVPSAELIREMSTRLELNDYEKSLNNSGQYRWVTNFRFYSIGLVKAGWIIKKGRTWILTEKARNFEQRTPQEIFDFMAQAYDAWNAGRTRSDDNAETADEGDTDGETEEPEVLMKVKPDDMEFQELIAGIAASRIQIPPFQRSFVWEPKDIRYLLDSIYRGYPVGSFIFWKTVRKLPRTRTIGNLPLDTKELSPGTEISYVLDGQQRITSLYAAVKGSTIDGEPYRFLFDLRKKKFTVSRADNETKDDLRRKDRENLQMSIDTIFLESYEDYRAITREYPAEYVSVLDRLHDRFVRYRFSLILVEDQTAVADDIQSEGVRQVVRMFRRINETGHTLSVVAKMVAFCWGEGFDLREELDAFFGREQELETIREETLLQAASAIVNYRKVSSRDILERTNIRKLEAEWDNIVTAFLLAVEFVKTKIHIKHLDYLPFDAVLVPLSYLFYKKRLLDHQQTQVVEQWFWKACLSNRYTGTLAAKLEEDCMFFDDLLEGKTTRTDYLIDWETLKSRLIAQRYNLRNAFVKTVLALYSYADPKNLTDGREVRFEGLFTGYYKHNLHHIFPQAYLRSSNPGQKELFDSIVNIMLIPAITNISISATPPRVYMAKLQETNTELPRILQHHYIPDVHLSGIPENDFLKFLDYRADQIVRAFRVCTGVGSPSEAYFATDPTRPIDILETRIRNFIHETLRQQAETSYWKEYIPQDIQENVNKKIQEDIKRHPYSLEEYDKDDVRIKFLDVMDYSKIILSNWNLFGSFFGSKSEVEKHFLALKNYRNPIKHGRDLHEVDRRVGEAAVLWLENIIG